MVSKVASKRAPAIEVNILARDKGKRKIADSADAEQSCKFIVDPLVQKTTLAIEVKRKQQDRRNAQRRREKQRMEEIVK